ncbi:MAG: glutathione S-transferase N-terminal domain-containing protein [Gammaproteobacteria bacterium]|nr:glutathione S-transferase N-terminal domain-containing protein [Gammaproteobacteria bacterium]
MLLKALREGLGRLIVFINFLTRPRPMQRSEEAQARVNEEASSLTLYQFYACPFCVRTRRAIHRLNLPIETRDAQNDPVDRQALKEGGGEIKVPCLRIEEAGETRWMYESMDIISYLEDRFGAKA